MALPKDRKYHIAFDTKNVPGKIEAVSVQLGVDIVGEEANFFINLADDPLYPKLRAYCIANAPGGNPRKSK